MPPKKDEPISPAKTDEEELIDTVKDTPIFYTDDLESDMDIGELKHTLESMANAIRPPPTGAEHMVANELALAVISESLEKIRHICEAFMILEEEEIQGLGLHTVKNKIERCYALTHAFQRYWDFFDYDEYYNPREMIKLAFPFPEEEAYDYLHPWATNLPFESFQTSGRLASKEIDILITDYIELFKNEIRNIENDGTFNLEVLDEVEIFKAKYLYWSFRDGVTHETFNSFVVAFIKYATPMAMQWFKKIMKKVSPSSFRDALTAFGAKIPT